MDNLTHSLFGALIGQAGLKRKTGLGMPALIIGANIPDVDATCTIYGIESLAMRRGITHGPPAMILLPLLLAAGLWGYDRWQAKRGKRPDGRLPVRFGWLYLLALIGSLSHPALDWMNSYGVRLLEPFSSRWFYGDVLFIIDIWLWLGLGFATWLSLRREKRGGEWRKPARIALSAALAYIGINLAVSRAAAEQIEPHAQTVIASPVPFKPWKRELIYLDSASERWMVSDYSLLQGVGQTGPVAKVQCLAFVGSPSDPASFDAFMFWSRAPFFEPLPQGGLQLRDARFYDPMTSGRFSVNLPEGTCVGAAAQ